MKTAIVSYIPALHQGYIKFFDEHDGDIFVLGTKFVHEHPRMDRDIRAMQPELVKNMLASAMAGRTIAVLENQADLSQYGRIIMPDEDVNRTFAKHYIHGHEVAFQPSFLRWDRQISTTEFEVPAGRVISKAQRDKELLGVAHDAASKSVDWWRQVGAVVARDGKPLLIGHNRPLKAEHYGVNVFGDPRSNFDAGEYIELGKTIHAEASTIGEAARRGIKLEGASIYVTTFPCPVCAKLIAAAGIKTVYYDKGYSLLDAEDVLAAHNIEIVLITQ